MFRYLLKSFDSFLLRFSEVLSKQDWIDWAGWFGVFAFMAVMMVAGIIMVIHYG